MNKQKPLPEDYENLKKFLGFYLDWFLPKAGKPEDHPLIFIAEVEKKSRANARRGLMMAISDFVEMSSDWTPEQVAAADKRFLENGVPSLSEIRAKYSKKYLQILKRGQIKSLQEYYLVKGVLDGGGIEPGAGEGEKLASMLASYELRVVAGSEK
jgi:hypothetical protein